MEYWAPCKASQCTSADIFFLFFSIFRCVSLRHILVLAHQRFLLFLACFDTLSRWKVRKRQEEGGKQLDFPLLDIMWMKPRATMKEALSCAGSISVVADRHFYKLVERATSCLIMSGLLRAVFLYHI